MPEFILRVGSRSAQGVRSNNEDNYVVDLRERLVVVADGMGGQDRGEVASSMAVEIIPRVIHARLAVKETPEDALRHALHEANDLIVQAGRSQPEGRRMGTTVVAALVHGGHVYIANLGDSRAYLIREGKAHQLTVDHSVAQALVLTGALTAEEARYSPYQHVLHKFLGCAELNGASEVHPYTPKAGDRLLLATDGMTNHVSLEELGAGPARFPEPQDLIEHLVEYALAQGSRDNVTGVVIVFDEAQS
ncbi:MAG: serine/threonine-protein phosphatase [Planctomycetes bacterium]|nr:serine/threonine-protein phosphatase [Planctomycetota bacterium]